MRNIIKNLFGAFGKKYCMYIYFLSILLFLIFATYLFAKITVNITKPNIDIANTLKSKTKIGFFCSSNQLLTPTYYNQLNKIFQKLNNSKYDIVYGGGEVGAMGQVGKLAIQNNFSLYAYDSVQFARQQYPEAKTKIFNSLIPRENEIIYNTDIAVILPGQYGTMMEFFWLATLNNLHVKSIKIIVWNIDNYFDLLISFLQTDAFQINPTKSLLYNKIIVCDTYEDVLFQIQNNA